MAYPKTAHAITIAKPGGIEVIQKTEIPLEVKPDHVVIKVEYLGVNFIDTYFRAGHPYSFKSYPAILGQEAAGVIVGLPSDPQVLSNEEYKKREFEIGNKVAVQTGSSHASFISVPWTVVAPVPSSVSTQTAAAGLLQGLTAVTFAHEAYPIAAGNTVFVHTVAGGLGLLLAQYASSLGAHVIGTTSTAEKAAEAKRAGARDVILYKNEDTVQRALELTNGQGVDVIYDGIGKDTFDNNFKFIKRKGTIVALGNTSGPIPPFSPLKLSEKNVKFARPTVMNYIVTPEERFNYSTNVFDLIEKGRMKIKVFKEYPFTVEGVGQAHTDLTSGKTSGKLVIKVADN